MATTDRRNAIIKIIEETEIARQEELVESLKNLGYDVTQATISRDIKELGLIKIKGEVKKFKYALPKTEINTINQAKIATLLKTFVVSIKRAQNLVIVKTLEGNGSACGVAIDKLNHDKIVGSIAGDDTVLIVCDNDFDAENMVDILEEIIYT
jgi:transcriptional regulator of arginine metabolism